MALDINLLKAKKTVDQMVKNGESSAYIDGFLSKVGYSPDQIKDVPVLDDKMLAGSVRLSQNPDYLAKQAKAEESRQGVEDLAKFQGDTRNIANMLTFNQAGELESALTGTPQAQIEQEHAEYAKANPVRNIVSTIGGAVANPLNAVGAGWIGKGANVADKIGRGALVGGATGGAYGFGSGKDGVENRIESGVKGVQSGAILGGAATGIGEGLKQGIKGVARSAELVKDRADKLPFIGKLLSKSQDELEDQVASLAGQSKSEEAAGIIARQGLEKVSQGIKSKSNELYSAADALAGDARIPLKKAGNFKQVLDDIYNESTKSGRKYLAKVADEAGAKPNYKQVRSLQSMLSADSQNGVSGLTANQVGRLKAGLDKDIEVGIGSKAKKALDSASKYYRNEMQNPNSLMSSVEDLKGTGKGLSDSEIGRRVIAAATSRAGKQTALGKLLQNVDNPDEIRNTIMANVTRRTNFNNMSPEQKAMVYGDKLHEADKIFNGVYMKSIVNLLKGVANKSDKVNTGAGIIPLIGASQVGK